MNKIINYIHYDLFIFDLDDTLIKTETYHYKAWLYTIQKELDNDSFTIDFNNFCKIFHSKEKDSIKKYIVDDLGIQNYDDIIAKKQQKYLDILHENYNNITLIDGLYEFLKIILDNNKKFVIVSNSYKSSIEFFLNKFSILKRCEKYYYRELYTNKKPDPECYIRVLKDFPNLKYIGFEDSITGIEALTRVKEIKPVFINTNDYIYYDYIKNNYDNLSIIQNYIF
jgi:beta-phosphoglucomutase-like phosphatase (HAD superfamily)